MSDTLTSERPEYRPSRGPQAALPPGVYEDVDFAVLVQIAGRMIAQYVEVIGKEAGLSAGHLSVLGMVYRKPDLVQNVYGSILAINDATLGRYVDKLETRGLLLRQRCAEDRRTVRLNLTPAGTGYILEVKSRLADLRAEVQGRLTAEQVEQLQSNLVTFLAGEGSKETTLL